VVILDKGKGGNTTFFPRRQQKDLLPAEVKGKYYPLPEGEEGERKKRTLPHTSIISGMGEKKSSSLWEDKIERGTSYFYYTGKRK